MDIHFRVSEVSIDERKLADATNAKLIEMYERIRDEMGDAGRDITFNPEME
jgi:hypothetical protein